MGAGAIGANVICADVIGADVIGADVRHEGSHNSARKVSVVVCASVVKP